MGGSVACQPASVVVTGQGLPATVTVGAVVLAWVLPVAGVVPVA